MSGIPELAEWLRVGDTNAADIAEQLLELEADDPREILRGLLRRVHAPHLLEDLLEVAYGKTPDAKARRLCDVAAAAILRPADPPPPKKRTRLSRTQLEELARLVKDPQPTFGRHRARIQNNLVRAGLAEIRPGVYDSERCYITDAGREALKKGKP